MESFNKPKKDKVESRVDDLHPDWYLEYEETEEEKKFREETSDFIESVDFEVLNTIFDEITKKSTDEGQASNTGFRINKNEIHFSSWRIAEGTIGHAHVADGSIAIKWPELDASLPEDSAHEKRSADVLDTLIHEGAHVRGGYKSMKKSTDMGLVGEPMPESWVKTEQVHVGLSEHKTVDEYSYSQNEGTKHVNTSSEKVGISLNEAITENIARQVFVEYCTRTGNSHYLKFEDRGGSYQADRVIFSLLLKNLAGELEVSEDDLWRSFVHAYMSSSVEIKKLLKELEDIYNNQPRMIELLNHLTAGESAHNFLDQEGLQELYVEADKIGVYDGLFLNKLRHNLGIR